VAFLQGAMMRKMLALLMLVAMAAVGGCTHLAGTVYDAQSKRPLPGAVFTVGHPAGIGVFDRKTADGYGRFDFQISPTDESQIYVYDGKSDPSSAQRVDKTEFGDHMKVYVRRGYEDQ
jgi:hypothetical protein